MDTKRICECYDAMALELREEDAGAEVKRCAATEREKRATERAIYAQADAERDAP